jgi:hypothetical protein
LRTCNTRRGNRTAICTVPRKYELAALGDIGGGSIHSTARNDHRVSSSCDITGNDPDENAGIVHFIRDRHDWGRIAVDEGDRNDWIS